MAARKEAARPVAGPARAPARAAGGKDRKEMGISVLSSRLRVTTQNQIEQNIKWRDENAKHDAPPAPKATAKAKASAKQGSSSSSLRSMINEVLPMHKKLQIQ